MSKYNIEGGIDFFDALYNSLDIDESYEKTDEDNNICVDYSILLQNELYKLIQENETLYVTIGEKIFPIPLSELYMKKKQFYRIKNEGLPQAQNDMYNISEKTDIIVKITFL